MKKIFTLALIAGAIATASAQYTVNPSTSVVVEKGGFNFVDYLVLSEAAISDFQKAGATMSYYGPDGDAQNLWIWENTYAGVQGGPRVDMEEGDAVCLEVGNAGWSGAGFNVQGNGVNTAKYDDNTRFHIAYQTPTGNGPASICLTIFDGEVLNPTTLKEEKSEPAQISLGAPFGVDKGTAPSVAPAATDEWEGLDMSFADIKKFWPAFDLIHSEHWKGNVLSFLAGAVPGKTFALDAIYFYGMAESGVEGVEADAEFILGNHTINSTAAGIVVYDLQGRTVKATASTTLGIDDLAAGVYVAKSGAKTVKFVVK